jgi:hypothetical protein
MQRWCYCRKKFSSELSIVADRQYKTIGPMQAPGSAPEATRLRLSSHRSDHEIHTPEHRSFVSNRQVRSRGETVSSVVLLIDCSWRKVSAPFKVWSLRKDSRTSTGPSVPDLFRSRPPKARTLSTTVSATRPTATAARRTSRLSAVRKTSHW